MIDTLVAVGIRPPGPPKVGARTPGKYTPGAGALDACLTTTDTIMYGAGLDAVRLAVALVGLADRPEVNLNTDVHFFGLWHFLPHPQYPDAFARFPDLLYSKGGFKSLVATAIWPSDSPPMTEAGVTIWERGLTEELPLNTDEAVQQLAQTVQDRGFVVFHVNLVADKFCKRKNMLPNLRRTIIVGRAHERFGQSEILKLYNGDRRAMHAGHVDWWAPMGRERY